MEYLFYHVLVCVCFFFVLPFLFFLSFCVIRYQLGYVNIACEGWNYAGDDTVVKDNCVLTFSLVPIQKHNHVSKKTNLHSKLQGGVETETETKTTTVTETQTTIQYLDDFDFGFAIDILTNIGLFVISCSLLMMFIYLICLCIGLKSRHSCNPFRCHANVGSEPVRPPPPPSYDSSSSSPLSSSLSSSSTPHRPIPSAPVFSQVSHVFPEVVHQPVVPVVLPLHHHHHYEYPSVVQNTMYDVYPSTFVRSRKVPQEIKTKTTETVTTSTRRSGANKTSVPSTSSSSSSDRSSIAYGGSSSSF